MNKTTNGIIIISAKTKHYTFLTHITLQQMSRQSGSDGWCILSGPVKYFIGSAGKIITSVKALI